MFNTWLVINVYTINNYYYYELTKQDSLKTVHESFRVDYRMVPI